MFDLLKKPSATSGEVVVEIRSVEVAIAEAEKKLAATESEAHGEILDAGAGGERRARELSGTLEAQKLRITALRTGLSRLKVALRAAVERKHDAQRAEAERTLKELEARKDKMREDFIPVAVKLIRAVGEAHGHAAAWRAGWVLRELAAGRCNVPQMGVREGFRTADDPLSRAVLAAIGDVEKSYADAPTRAEAAMRILNPFPPVDVDAEVAVLLGTTQKLPGAAGEEAPVKPKAQPEDVHYPAFRYEGPGEEPHGGGAVKIA